jgi:hypothetical protein
MMYCDAIIEELCSGVECPEVVGMGSELFMSNVDVDGDEAYPREENDYEERCHGVYSL